MRRKIALLLSVILLSLIMPIAAKSEDIQQNTQVQSSPNETNILIPDPLLIQELYEEWLLENFKQDLIKKAESLKGTRQGQCVVAVRKFLGVGRSEVQGLAKNTKTNSTTPEIGAIVKLKESRYGHVAVVLDITETQIYVYESNYARYERASTRWINIDSPRIQGYRIINNLIETYGQTINSL